MDFKALWLKISAYNLFIKGASFPNSVHDCLFISMKTWVSIKHLKRCYWSHSHRKFVSFVSIFGDGEVNYPLWRLQPGWFNTCNGSEGWKSLCWDRNSLLVTHHTVIVYQLQLVVRQYVGPLIHKGQSHLSCGEARLSAWPASTHGEEGSDVELLLA